jgi:hypothetical protein
MSSKDYRELCEEFVEKGIFTPRKNCDLPSGKVSKLKRDASRNLKRKSKSKKRKSKESKLKGIVIPDVQFSLAPRKQRQEEKWVIEIPDVIMPTPAEIWQSAKALSEQRATPQAKTEQEQQRQVQLRKAERTAAERATESQRQRELRQTQQQQFAAERAERERQAELRRIEAEALRKEKAKVDAQLREQKLLELTLQVEKKKEELRKKEHEAEQIRKEKEAQRLASAAKRKAEQDARQAELAQRRAEEDTQRRAAAEKRKAQEEEQRQTQEGDAIRLKAEREAKDAIQRVEDEKRRAEEEAQKAIQKAEAEKRQADLEAQRAAAAKNRKAEEDARLKAQQAEEAKRKAEEDARQAAAKAEADKRKAEEDARQTADKAAAAKRKAEEDAKRAMQKAEDEKRRAEEERTATAQIRKAEEEARQAETTTEPEPKKPTALANLPEPIATRIYETLLLGNKKSLAERITNILKGDKITQVTPEFLKQIYEENKDVLFAWTKDVLITKTNNEVTVTVPDTALFPLKVSIPGAQVISDTFATTGDLGFFENVKAAQFNVTLSDASTPSLWTFVIPFKEEAATGSCTVQLTNPSNSGGTSCFADSVLVALLAPGDANINKNFVGKSNLDCDANAKGYQQTLATEMTEIYTIIHSPPKLGEQQFICRPDQNIRKLVEKCLNKSGEYSGQATAADFYQDLARIFKVNPMRVLISKINWSDKREQTVKRADNYSTIVLTYDVKSPAVQAFNLPLIRNKRIDSEEKGKAPVVITYVETLEIDSADYLTIAPLRYTIKPEEQLQVSPPRYWSGSSFSFPDTIVTPKSTYQLASFVVYDGFRGFSKDQQLPSGGHYLAYVRCPGASSWLEFNDLAATKPKEISGFPKAQLEQGSVLVFYTRK